MRTIPFRRLAAAAGFTLSLLSAPAAHAAVVFDADVGSIGESAIAYSHLPQWLQVSDASATLYARDSGSAQVDSRLSRYTFLRVLGAGATRLQVQAYGEGGAPGTRGWVDPEQVLPSMAGTDWLVASTATTLWRGADSSAVSARAVDLFTPLQQIDGPVQGRIEVRVYRPDFGGSVDQGWVDQADTGPALAPQTRVAAVDGAAGLRAPAVPTQQTFLDSAAQAALASSRHSGVPASVTVAQAILESDWGRSTLATGANNYFGIKAMGGLGSDGVVWMPTSEFDSNGGLYQTVSPFRAYKSLSDSMTDHARLVGSLARYAPAMNAASDPRQFATLLASGGYSTDPDYPSKLIALMDRYDLYRLDA